MTENGQSPGGVAIVGVGEIGRGWAALCSAAGLPVSIYDRDDAAVRDAMREIRSRVARLAQLGRVRAHAADDGIRLLRSGRSLLDTLAPADWVVEATPEDLVGKRRVLEEIEQVCRPEAVLTSSSSGLHASDLCARLRRPERLVVAHPLTPVELLPLVEVIPGPLTDSKVTSRVATWLTALGQVPIVLRREVPGNVVGRIAAAVWREGIQLVLDGVVDVRDLDRAVSLGPALGWTAAGPHLTYHLAAGDQGIQLFLANLIHTFEDWWQSLATWNQLTTEEQNRLIQAIEKTYGTELVSLRAERDARLMNLVRVLSGGQDR